MIRNRLKKLILFKNIHSVIKLYTKLQLQLFVKKKILQNVCKNVYTHTYNFFCM